MTLDKMKTIHDPLHGSIKVDGPFLEILDRHEMQRLRGVRQLGFGNMVFPGANHTRFEHSLGVYHLAGRMASAIGLSEEDSLTVRAAGLLHDICHAPFSHTMEEIVEDRTGSDHMSLAGDLIKGRIPTHGSRDDDILAGKGTIADILEKNGISSDSVCGLIEYPDSRNDGLDAFSGDTRTSHFRSRDYMHQIIHGPVDADQMDYLVRDAHYTGVTHGSIDIERLLSTMKVFNDRIVLERRGVAAAEGLMVSRSLMYTSVYYHRTVRIIRMMLTKAAEASSIDVENIHLWTDADLMDFLTREGGTPSRIVRSVQNRVLYKKAVTRSSEETSDDLSELLSKHSGYRNRKALEQEIADKAGVDVSKVIVDIPPRSALLSSVNIGKTDVSILDEEGKVRSLTKLSSIAKALQSRDTFGWTLLVASPEEDSEPVAKAARKVLGL
ncbi:MAG: HD domain-containing protein [Candidatus Methanoplasma sp.]|jgi:HD superfamily phosphohydrolase|nr:HD domain-containing protein [Candidatus Methanoplasma sp.]